MVLLPHTAREGNVSLVATAIATRPAAVLVSSIGYHSLPWCWELFSVYRAFSL